MKKRLLCILMMALMCITAIGNPKQVVKAEELPGVEIDYSYLTAEGALIGHMQGQTRGVYLADGSSSITQIDARTAGAGGSTTATQDCKVSVLVIMEQLKDGSWGYWTSWTATLESDIVVMTGRAITVTPGYYYRVRCTHKAGSDTSSSWTGGLYF